MDIWRDILPIALLVLIAAYLWWINKDRRRANTYMREAERNAEYRESAMEYNRRSTEHMERVEKALDRIASALEGRKDA